MKSSILLPVLLFLLSVWTLSGATLESLKEGLNLKIEELSKPLTSLESLYEGELRKLEVALQTEGELESLLQVKKEIDSFRSAEEVAAGAYDNNPKLRSLRQTFTNNRNRLVAQRHPKIRAVHELYRNELLKLKTELTQQNKLGEALIVSEEQKRVDALLASPEFASRPLGAGLGAEEKGMVGKSAYFEHHTAEEEIWVEFEEEGKAVWVGLGQLAVSGWVYEESSKDAYLFWDPRRMNRDSAFMLKLTPDRKTGVVDYRIYNVTKAAKVIRTKPRNQ